LVEFLPGLLEALAVGARKGQAGCFARGHGSIQSIRILTDYLLLPEYRSNTRNDKTFVPNDVTFAWHLAS
jgi:hypothetical protein